MTFSDDGSSSDSGMGYGDNGYGSEDEMQLLEQGVKPWDSDADDVYSAINGGEMIDYSELDSDGYDEFEVDDDDNIGDGSGFGLGRAAAPAAPKVQMSSSNNYNTQSGTKTKSNARNAEFQFGVYNHRDVGGISKS